ncbi:hypothetical protein ACEN9F_13580 [Duganella sp. CT11-25]|uniref:hypothetical protein n=1 Tax=unclassified Duganella TaxID=2636909 RepID=UPI0039B04348
MSDGKLKWASNWYPNGITVEELAAELAKAVASGHGKAYIALSAAGGTGACEGISVLINDAGTVWLEDFGRKTDHWELADGEWRYAS